MSIVTKSGGRITASGYPMDTTEGKAGFYTRDAGQPLIGYSSHPTDPLQLWKSQPALRKVVSFIARNVASVSWHAYERVSDADRQRRASSPAERVLARPQRFQSGFRFWELITTDLMIFDRYVAVVTDGGLTRIPPAQTRIVSNWLGQPSGIELLTPAGQDNIDLTEFPLMVGWGWSPGSAGGVSPMYTLAEILAESRRAVQWRRQQWDNSPKFNGVLKHPSTFKNPETRERVKNTFSSWRDRNQGTPILEDGVEYETIDGFDASKFADDAAGRQLTDAEVASAFHVPPELVGARAGNFSSVSVYRRMLFGPVLKPIFKDLEQAVNAEIVPHLDATEGLYLEADRETAMDGSPMERAQMLQTMTGGPTMTRAEARSALNLPFIEGTQDLIVPMNVTAGGLASPTDTGSQNRGENYDGPAEQAETTRSLLVARARQMLDAGERSPTVVKADGRVLRRDVPRVADDQERRRGEAYAGLTSVLERQRAAIEAAGHTVDPGGFHEQWDSAVAAELITPITLAAHGSARTVLDRFNPDGDGWSIDAMAAYLAAMATNTAGRLNAGVLAAVDDAQVGTDPGTDEQAEATRNAFTTLTQATAVAWAGTVVADAAGFGGYDAAKASGGGSGTKTWLVNSSNPRESHAAMNGETVPIDGRFSNGGKWPGDAVSLAVEEMAGCMCGVEWTVG